MMKSNSSVPLNTSNLYEHPWYTQLHLLGNTTTSESRSQPKPKSEKPGQKFTDCQHCGGPLPEPYWDTCNKAWKHEKQCTVCKNLWQRHRFRLTKEDRKQLNLNPECQICGASDDLVVDHCHSTNKIRGYLCNNHNKAIGLFGDNLEHLTSAINYLNLHNGS
jgi:hypothetical protein